MRQQKQKYGIWVFFLTLVAIIVHSLKWATEWSWPHRYGNYIVFSCIGIAVILMVMDKRNLNNKN